MPQFLGAPGDLPPPSPEQQSSSRKSRDAKDDGSDTEDDGDVFALAASLLVSPSPSLLPSSVSSPRWSEHHAAVEELNARAHADVADGKGREVVPLALARAVSVADSRATADATSTRTKTPLASVVEHLLVASAWRSRALPSILRSIEDGEGDADACSLRLYGMMRHDVSCANLLSVALSAPPPPQADALGSRFAVPSACGLPPLVRALREERSSVATALAAWAARSVRWWDGAGGRGAARRTAEAAAAASASSTEPTKASPSLAADETALAAASSALAVFRCLAQAAEDLPPSVGAVLSGAGAGDLVPVLLSLLDSPPWISKVGEKTFALGGAGWERLRGQACDPRLLLPLPTAHAWLSLLHLCVGASFSSSDPSSFCALRSDERDWSPEGGGQAVGSRIAFLLKKSPAALAAVPSLAAALLPLAEAAAAGRGPGGTKRVRREASSAAFISNGGGSNGFFASAPSPLVVEVASKANREEEEEDIESAIDGTHWESVAAECVERLSSKKAKKGGEDEKEGADDGGGDGDGETAAAGLDAVVRALEGSAKLASLGNAVDEDDDGGFTNKKNPLRIRVTAWAPSGTDVKSDDEVAPPLPPWTESFELEVDESSEPEEVELPPGSSPGRGVRRKLRVVAEAGATTATTLPPEGRLVASSSASSSSPASFSSAATYGLPSCDLSLDIDALPKSLWVTLGSLEGDREEDENDDKNDDDGDSKNRFVLQLKLRRQPCGKAARRSRGEPWGCYAPCGGALTTPK